MEADWFHLGVVLLIDIFGEVGSCRRRKTVVFLRAFYDDSVESTNSK